LTVRAEAEQLHKLALEINEKALSKDHSDTVASLNSLANLYKEQLKYAEAERLYKRALEIFEKALWPEHPEVATILENYAALLREINHEDEGEASANPAC
jgi:tetratricopeptide (TPR) repeat protein